MESMICITNEINAFPGFGFAVSKVPKCLPNNSCATKLFYPLLKFIYYSKGYGLDVWKKEQIEILI